MSISSGNIDFSKLFQTQSTGNNGAAAANNVQQGGDQKSQGAEMDKFMKDMNGFKNFHLQ
jgi:hypothetical protein